MIDTRIYPASKRLCLISAPTGSEYPLKIHSIITKKLHITCWSEIGQDETQLS